MKVGQSMTVPVKIQDFDDENYDPFLSDRNDLWLIKQAREVHRPGSPQTSGSASCS
jgi:hypothetical protein